MDNGAALATNTRCAVATACTDHKLRAALRFLIANSLLASYHKTYNAQQLITQLKFINAVTTQ